MWKGAVEKVESIEREREEERDREQAQVCCLGVENEEGTKAS